MRGPTFCTLESRSIVGQATRQVVSCVSYPFCQVGTRDRVRVHYAYRYNDDQRLQTTSHSLTASSTFPSAFSSSFRFLSSCSFSPQSCKLDLLDGSPNPVHSEPTNPSINTSLSFHLFLNQSPKALASSSVAKPVGCSVLSPPRDSCGETVGEETPGMSSVRGSISLTCT
jgi:hypothetical protein